MVTEPIVEFDRSILGLEVDGGTFEATKERILRFVKAVGETNPIFSDEQAAKEAGYDSVIAPPAFANLCILGSERPDPKVQFGNLSFFAGQALEYHLPIKPGDKITARTALEDVYPKTGRSGTMVFIVWRTVLTNQKGEVVATARESFVRR